MAELYRAADIFTLGSLKEMMPIALLEATASGLPCVVHRHPVMQWMIGPGGHAADLSCPGGWAATVVPLLRDRQRRVELGQLARAHCLQHFSRDQVVDRILSYYDFVLHHDRGRKCDPGTARDQVTDIAVFAAKDRCFRGAKADVCQDWTRNKKAMCGIAGILRWDAQPPDAALLNHLSALIAHRGPDDVGSVIKGPVGFAHRRLSILDLTAAGHQPMQVDDGSAMVAYNGEVYNYIALRTQLESEGISFRSTGDTEVLLKACQAWGVLEAAQRFDGMFAFAYWDGRNHTLWLVRDRTGIKPLYYHCHGQRVIFASEMRALLGEVRPEPDDSSLLTLLMDGPMQEPRTLFHGIQAVEAGSAHYFTADGQHRSQRFASLEDWIDPDLYWELNEKSDEEVVELFDQLVSTSVRMHLASDAKLATLASGGLDSSVVSTVAGEHQFGLSAYHANVVGHLSELPYAEALSAHTSQPLRVTDLTPDAFLRCLVHVTHAQ